jgi:cbb3-type cytochrome oxidase subunit 3
MKKNKKREVRWQERVMESRPAILTVAILGILLSLVFTLSELSNEPVTRDEAIAYTGEFVRYEVWRNGRIIHFADGTTQEVYPHTEPASLARRMETLERGTVLHLLINPNNDYVAEIRTDTEELLNFESSQEDIKTYGYGYVGIGIFMLAVSVFLIGYVMFSWRNEKREEERHAKRSKMRVEGENDRALRRAERTRCRILLEASVDGYDICYRRVRKVNELVICGIVYDEMEALIELEHRLIAELDGHTFEAGFDEQSHSYISYDGERIAEKMRWI